MKRPGPSDDKLSKLEELDKFVCVSKKTYASTIAQAKELIHQSQHTERTWVLTALQKHVYLAWQPLGDYQHISPGTELPMNIYNFFDGMILPERLLSKYLAEAENVHLSKTRRKLVELYIIFSECLERVLIRLGLDAKAGTLVTPPLHRAVRLGDVLTLRSLLQHGVSARSVDYFGRNALHVTAESNAPHMLSELLFSSKELPEINSVDEFGRSPIYLGIHAGNTEIVRRLLALQGKKPRNDNEWRALLTLAAESGSIALVRLLLLAYGGDFSLGSKRIGSAALIAAASAGHLDVVRLVVAANADLHGTAGGEVNALGAAVVAGHCEIVSFLLRAGSNVNDRKDQWTKAPVHHAVEQGNSEIFHLLLQAGADMNARFIITTGNKVGRRYRTLIELASECGNLCAVRHFLGHPKVALNRQLKAYDRSPLELAAKEGHESVVDLLLSFGAHVNILYKRLSSTTPLLEAVSGGHLSITRKLIAAGADVNAFYSKAKGYYELVPHDSLSMDPASLKNVMVQSNTLNIGNQAECHTYEQVKEIDEEDSEDESLDDVESSVESCVHDTALQLAARLGHVMILQVLLEAGAAVNASPQYRGGTALQYAAAKGYLDIVEILLGAGATVEMGYGRMTALQCAAQGGCHGICELLLRRGMQVDETPPRVRKETPLRLAAKGKHVQIVRLLLDCAADINGQSQHGGATPLKAAAFQGALDVVRLLLNAGAVVDARPGSPFSYVEPTALQAAACGNENIDIVRALLVAGADPNAPPGADGFTALGNAVVISNSEMTKTLLTVGAQPEFAFTSRSPKLTSLQAASKKGHVVLALFGSRSGAAPYATSSIDTTMTAMQMAARLGHYNLVTFLLEAGVEADSRSSQRGKTALICSLEEGYQDIARLLIEAGADVNTASALRYTALRIAVMDGLDESVDRLLRAGADANTASGIGFRALQIAATDGSDGSVDRLLRAGADVNGAIETTATALVLGIRHRRTNIVRRLLEADADVNIDHPLEEAAATNQIAMAKMLLDRKADPIAVTSLGEYYSPPMETAVLKGHTEMVHLLLDLLDAGTNLQVMDCPLVVAAGGNHLKIEEILLAAGADPDAAYRDHRALIDAVELGHQESVCLLLEAGADPNKPDHLGKIALSIAARKGYLDIVRNLLLAGADVNAMSTVIGVGLTPLHEAASKGHSEIVRLLLTAGADLHSTTTFPAEIHAWEQTALNLAMGSREHETVQILQNADQGLPLGSSRKRKRVDSETELESESESDD